MQGSDKNNASKTDTASDKMSTKKLTIHMALNQKKSNGVEMDSF